MKALIKRFLKKIFLKKGNHLNDYSNAHNDNIVRPKTIRGRVPAFFDTNNIDVSGKDVYEFGIYSGESMKHIADSYEKHNFKIRKMFGFDSFEGLPEEKKDPHGYKDWYPGAFSSAELFKTRNKDEIVKKVLEVIGPRSYPVMLIPGFWDKILNDSLVEECDMRPASYIDIDCDIYTSAYLALDFMFRNKLATMNTLIGYDDWGGTLIAAKEYNGGESRAHKEIQKKYNVDFSLLYKIGNPPNVQVLFKIESIG